MSMTWPSLLTSGLVFAGAGLLLSAALHDFAARTVPNGLTAVLAFVGIALRALAGSLLPGLLVGVIVFVLAAVCWRRGWMGGGDVKLLAATALVVPPALALSFVTAVALCGGVLSLGYLLAPRFVAPPGTERPHSLLARAVRAERWRIRRGGPLPYACAIAAGGLIILL
ncbi:MAG TPA: A24 family peptidase [Acetobacteraceae bacterium]|nr:A24 family peptidase [Acetobacteraceae bacterium]